MPPKKQSRKSNKKKPASKQQQPTSSGGTDETSNSLRAWSQSGEKHVNAKGLSRALPHVAQAIRDGSIEPKQVPKMVQQASQDHIMAALTKHLGPDFATMPVTRVQSLEIMTNAEPLLCDLVRVACGGDEKMSHAFAHDFFFSQKLPEKWGCVRDTIHMVGEQITKLDKIDLLLEVQQAYDRTCEKWKHEIERLTKKPLAEHVWAYKKHPAEFVFILGKLIVGHKVEAAARAIENGWDTIRHQCWECGQGEGPNVQVSKCSLCKAARYCSKECQRKSRKSGHKGAACDELKVMYQRFMANYLCINQALKLSSFTTTNRARLPRARWLVPWLRPAG
jgi:hypothetical protein